MADATINVTITQDPQILATITQTSIEATIDKAGPSGATGATGAPGPAGAASDTAYDASTWNANTDAPTKNAVRDKIETMDTAIVLNTSKVTYPSADSTKVGHITVTQAVNLDTIESDTVTNNAKTGITAGQASDITTNNAKISFDSTSSTRLANTSGTNTGDNATNTQYSGLVTNANHTGDATGSTALTIAANAVTNAKAAQMATKTYKGRTSALTGDSEDVAVATLKTDLVLVKADVGLSNVDNTSNATERAATATLSGKRMDQRITSAASYTTNTGSSLDVSTTDLFVITAQAGALLFNSPGGTPLQGQRLIIRIKDDGTARALTWNAVFRALGTPLPSITIISKTLYLGFMYNSTDTTFDLIASAQQ